MIAWYRISSLLIMVLLVMVTCAAAAGPGLITIDMSEKGPQISPLLYGIFFEEINRAGDGGLYGEMLENRSFEDDKSNPSAWQSLGKGKIVLDTKNPIHPRNITSLRIDMTDSGAGVANSGFSGAGLAIQSGAKYDVSLYVRGDNGFNGPVFVRLESRTGQILAQEKIASLSPAWKKQDITLKAKDSDQTARFVLEAQGKGSVWFDMVSMFPAQTWKGHGMRNDLGKMIENMHPSFVRFPGGCFVEGDRIENAVRWKETIGPMAQRKGNRCIWGYQTTGGFGLHEFLQWCQDLQAEPLYVINCGMAHEDHVPMDQMKEYVQDAMDLIEYANGPVTSEWGSKRAAAGHPEPFNLKYIQIGNENGGPLYNERYTLFHDAIKAKYPQMQLIACVWGGTPKDRPLEIIDEHYYNTPKFFMQKAHIYDSYDRKGPKIYVGEYAVTQGCGQGNLVAALGEAAFMTGLEANADIVIMASYAPLFVYPPIRRWNPNAIVFDQGRCYGTPSYHVQSMFAKNRADVVCPVQVHSPVIEASGPQGGISIGTWVTQAEFKDIKVTRGDKVLFESDFSKGYAPFRTHGRGWKTENGVLRQISDGEAVMAAVGDASWGSDYVLSLKARKISGNEGFLIGFQLSGDMEKHWLNLGGWGNTQHGLEGVGDNKRIEGKIEADRWYDIRIELSKGQVSCFLDGNKILSDKEQPSETLFATAGSTADGRQVILKVVNTSEAPIKTDVSIKGIQSVSAKAKGWILTSGNMMDENTFERPDNIVPREIKIDNASSAFSHAFPARSVTILRLDVKN